MGFTAIPDRAAGYALAEADWDAIKDNFNTGTWVLLDNTTLSGTASAITFSSISQSYAHLMIRSYLRSSQAAFSPGARIRFNNDSGANYDHQIFGGGAASLTAAEVFGDTSASVGNCPGSTTTANVFSSHDLTIPHYTGANNKCVLGNNSFKGSVVSNGMIVSFVGGFWRSNSAITRIDLIPGAGSFVAGSRATLYGLA
jgi:hypothetical protein